MHDCIKTREQLVDLVFDELGQEARRQMLTELQGCRDCLAQYRSMTETLRVFDQAVETAMPDDGYWPGYEAGLRIRLQQERPNLKQRLAGWIGGFGILPARPLPLAAGLALVLLAIGWLWNWQRQHVVTPSQPDRQLAETFPTPRADIASPAIEVAVVTKPGELANKRKSDRPKTAKPDGRSPSVPPEERGSERVASDVDSMGFNQPMIAASLFTPETIKHFEKAQLLLRSFRNARTANGSATADLAYEKQLSQRLLYQNILLRRDAEMKGNLPAEEALGSLEPFLLDIANLPDKPSPGELKDIRERMQRKEMVAALQINSAQPSLPTYPNQ